MLTAATALFCLITGAVTFWAIYTRRIERARAQELTRGLDRAREESRSRMRFLNAISHDLRTPLNGVTLQTYVIEQAARANDTKALQHALAEIRDSSTLAAKILTSLLQYARTEVEENTLTCIDLHDLLQETIAPVRAVAEENHLTLTLNAPDALLIEIDRAKLRRIVENLLDNAVKFTHHGSVTVQARQSEDHQQRVIIEVSDTGPGILPGDEAKLFNEFFQANNPSRDARLGLGLGLVVARRLTEQLGGTLSCRSAVGQGSIFRVELPTGECVIGKSPAQKKEPKLHGGGPTVAFQ